MWNMKRLKQSGIVANYEAIARGIFDMLPGEYLGALAFGMCPAPFMELAEKEFVRKIVISSLRRSGTPETQENIDFCAQRIDKELPREFSHNLTLALLKVAKEKGILRV